MLKLFNFSAYAMPLNFSRVVHVFQKSYLSFDQVKIDGLMGRLNEFNDHLDEV